MITSIRASLFFIIVLVQLCSARWKYHDSTWSPDYVLEATAQNVTIDCESRYSVVVNGTVPGPTLYLKENQTTWIRVYNNIPDQNFTLHWHGLTQRTAPFSDGTPLVSQWPIAPGQFFDYELHPDIGDAGSYFYHSHVGFQAVTAQGPLIVQDAFEPAYKYQDEIVINFSDYYAKSDSAIVDGLVANPFKWSGEPDAILFNDRSGTSSFGNASHDSCKPYVVKVKPGETYRMRFLGRTALSFVTVGFEDHDNLTIIEADGQYTQPFTTDRIQLGTGQRFSVLFTAKSLDEIKAVNKTQYWIRYESRARPTNVTGYALLQYDMDGVNRDKGSGMNDPHPSNLPQMPPVTLPNEINDWLEYSLTPLRIDPDNSFPPTSSVTRTIHITMSQELFNGAYVNKTINGTLVWAQNTNVWQEAALQNTSYFTPYLVNLYNDQDPDNYSPSSLPNGAGNTDYTYNTYNTDLAWDPTTKLFPARVGEVLDIVWYSSSGPTGGFDVHPLHAHGAHYWDLGSGNDAMYNATANDAAHFSTGYIPMRRDTTNLYRYAVSSTTPDATMGWRAWRIRVTEDDVGLWMMHCHILQHMIMGMSTVWMFGDKQEVLARFPTAPYPTGYLEYGGSAYGNQTDDPFVWENWD